jgi:hypothetical protein
MYSCRRRGVALALFSVVAVAPLAGCSSSGSAVNKTKFCDDVATIDKLLAPVGAPDTPDKDAQFVKIFKDNLATVNDFGKTAPSAIKADSVLLTNTINAVVKANSMDGFPAGAEAGGRMGAYCGLNNDGTPIGSTPTVTT